MAGPGSAGLIVVTALIALAGCNAPGGSQLPAPSAIASKLPALEVPTSSVISTTGACLDPATFALLNQLQAQGADVPTLLAGHRQALMTGLRSFQPQDAATGTWRDQLVADLQANDLTGAATEIRMLVSAEVAVAGC